MNDQELAEAHWFSRDDFASGRIALPPPQSIAFKLIEQWFDEADGYCLADLELSTDFRK